MGWHQVSDKESNDDIAEILDDTNGIITTVVPTWFGVSDIQGNITSLADGDYVDYAHEKNVDVWARVSEIDGINVAFEMITEDTAIHYIQFIRELSIETRRNKIVLSVSNYPVNENDSFMQWDEQSEVADYIILLSYGEYNNLSGEAGPTASLPYVQESIDAMIEYVPSSRLICGIPFYNRIWEEVAENSGSSVSLTSSTFGMKGFVEKLNEVKASIIWDDENKYNCASWTAGKKAYKVWVEDEMSIKEKIQLIAEYKLAGIGAWRIGIEESAIWSVIDKYLER